MKYDIERSCGCSERHEIYGPHKERASRIRWLESTSCTECKAENSDLEGTPKQIAWAIDIRDVFVEDVRSRAHPSALGMCEEWIANLPLRASWWIDNRDTLHALLMVHLDPGKYEKMGLTRLTRIPGRWDLPMFRPHTEEPVEEASVETNDDGNDDHDDGNDDGNDDGGTPAEPDAETPAETPAEPAKEASMWMTVKDAARKLGRHISTIYRWIKKGQVFAAHNRRLLVLVTTEETETMTATTERQVVLDVWNGNTHAEVMDTILLTATTDGNVVEHNGTEYHLAGHPMDAAMAWVGQHIPGADPVESRRRWNGMAIIRLTWA